MLYEISFWSPQFQPHILLHYRKLYFGQSHVTLDDLSFIHLTEDGDDYNQNGRLFFNNNTDLAAFAALSLFPLLFLAAACGGALLQWMMSGGMHDKDCDDHYYYDSGYGGGGGHSSGYGHGGGYRRSSDDEEGYDYDYKRSYQKRSTNYDADISGTLISEVHMD